MHTDTFFQTVFQQFTPDFKEPIMEEEKEKSKEENIKDGDTNLKFMNCLACRKGTIYIKNKLHICPICKGHSKLIINIINGKKYHFGEITNIYNNEDK